MTDDFREDREHGDMFMLAPKPDITTYELALLWASCKMELRRDLYDKLPPEVRRHFEPSTHNFSAVN